MKPALVAGLLVAPWLVAVGPAQSTWKVNCHGGPGIHFTDLPTAVAAAADGDTIWVVNTTLPCPVIASPYPIAPTIDKQLSITGMVIYPTPAPVGHPPLVADMVGLMTVSGVPAGKRVVVSNLNPSSIYNTATAPVSGLRVINCSGEVVLDGLYAGNGGYPNQVLEIVNCSNVTINNSTFFFGPSSLRIVNSTVRMSWSLMNCWTPPAQFGGYTDTQPAIDLENSTLTLTGSSITGANQMQTVYGIWWSKPGIVLSNSVLNIGPATTIRGGNTGSPGSYGISYQPKYPWSLPSVIRRDSRTILQSQFYPAPIVVDQSSTYTQPAVANQDMGLVIAGPVGGFALLLFSDLPWSPNATPFGSMLLDPIATTLVDIHFLPASTGGFASKYYFVPSTARNAHPYVVQSLTLSPSGELGFTAPMPFTIGWEHGRIP